MIKATRPGDWITDLFPRHPTERQLQTWRNIWWRVCLMHIPPRHSRFDFERDFGSTHLPNILEGIPFKMHQMTQSGGQHLLLVFPERHLTTQEEYALVPALQKHPQIKDAPLTIIDLVTKSPLIIGNFLADDIRIVREKK